MARMDVFYVADGHQRLTAAYLRISRSWDGSLYAETNVRAFAGPDKNVFLWGGVLACEGHRSHCGATWQQRQLLKEGHLK